jgi:hypothetical protein
MTNLLTNYIVRTNNEVVGQADLSRVFPQIKVQTAFFKGAGSYSVDSTTTFTLAFPGNNYFVIPNVYTNRLDDADNMSSNTYVPIVLKNASGLTFDIYIRFQGTLTLTDNSYICCLVVYYNTSAPSTSFRGASDVSFFATAAGSIANIFPNYTYTQSVYTTSGGTQNISVNYNFNTAGKGPSGIDYMVLGGYNSFGTVGYLSSVVNPFIFPNSNTVEKTGSQFNYTTVIFGGGTSMDVTINVLGLFTPLLSDQNLKNYNPQFKANNTLFRNLFPRCEKYIRTLNQGQSEGGTVNLSVSLLDQSNTASYEVFPVFEYNTISGSSSTYNKYEASTAANTPIVSGKTNTGFFVTFTKSTGEIWSGNVVCLVVYTN